MQPKYLQASDFPDAESLSLINANNMAQADPQKELEMLQHNNENKTLKPSYYYYLKESNLQMLLKIKSINKALDEQVKTISHKLISKFTVPQNKRERVHSQRNTIVQRKYKQLDTIKKQLQSRLLQKRSLQTLQQNLQSLKSEYKAKYSQMQQSLHTLNKLKRLCDKDQLSTYTNKQGQRKGSHNKSSFTDDSLHKQIKTLKQQIKMQTDRIYRQKDSFIRNNRHGHSHSHYRVGQQDKVHIVTNMQNSGRNNNKLKNRSYNKIQADNKGNDDGDEYLPENVRKLKQEYETIGKRIELLKIQKLALSMKDDHSQRKKYLEHLRSKIIELRKISA